MKKWLRNFWYYYKVPALVFLTAAAGVLYLYFTQRETVHSDYDVAVVTPRSVSAEQRTLLRGILEQAGQDQDGDGTVSVQIHIYRFSIGESGQDQNAVAGLDADLVGKLSGLFFTESPQRFEASTNGFNVADAIPVSNIPLLSGCGIDDLHLLIRTDADQKYASLISAITE